MIEVGDEACAALLEVGDMRDAWPVVEVAVCAGVATWGEAFTADAAAAEYRMGGRIVGTALGAGTLGVGSFADAAGIELLDVLDPAATRPVGR